MKRLATILLLLMFWAAVAAAEPVVVVHPDVDRARMSDDTLQRIFLGKKTRWKGGVKIVPVMLKEGDLHEEFVESLLDRSLAKFVTYWKQAVFTGRGVPPRSFATLDEVRFFIASTPGAIGYLDGSESLEGVKVLTID